MPAVWEPIWSAAREKTYRKMDQGETLMRCLLVLLLILVLVYPVMATQQMFTNIGDDYNIAYYYSNYPHVPYPGSFWLRTAGGDNLAYTPLANNYQCIRYNFPYQMTYSAVTSWGCSGLGTGLYITMYDANGNSMVGSQSISGTFGRFEMKMDGGTPRFYDDGVLIKSLSPIAQNPSYMEWCSHSSAGQLGACQFDDYVIAEPNAMQMSLPETNDNYVIILKDIVNPAQSGLAYGENATIINSNLMSGWWSRGNATIGADVAQPNESIEFKHLETGQVYATNWTGTVMFGSMTWNIKTMILDSGAPQGYYYLYRPKTGETSNMILYMSNGANVQWSSPKYSAGDSATVIYYVLDGGYWDTSTYSYRLDIYDVYGNVKATNAITASSGTIYHSWSADDEPGIYYAMLIAKDGSGNDYYLGTDQTELVSYFRVYGSVNDGPNQIVIPGALVNITQSSMSINQSIVTGSIGNYTTDAVFVTGGVINVTVTADGYRPHIHTFTPLISKTIALNVTLLPLTPVPGLAIDGVAYDPTYGRPLDGVQVLVRNISNAQSYSRTTNVMGWYQCGLLELCDLVNERPYDVNGTKLGFSNSQIYNVTARGVLT